MKIDVLLDTDFTSKLQELKYKYGDDIASLNSFSDSTLSHTDFIDNFISKDTVADTSADPNSNVSRHDMPTLLGEMPKSHRKLLSYNKLYSEIKKKYGKETADEWLECDYDGHLYLHDAPTSSFLHYCYAYDLKDLAEKGLYFLDNGQFNAEPPQHLETFIDFVKEFISFTCNRSSGAVGLPNLIPYMFYFWRKDCETGHFLNSPEYYAKQQIQRFIYGVNQPYTRDGVQSAFTNTSIFDHEYFEAIFGGAVFPDGSFMIDFEEESIEFQKMFLEQLSEIRSLNMMTFPVNTISLLYDDVNKCFRDEEFARWAIEHNRKWNDSNLFIDSDITSLSNCCRLKSNIEDLGYFNSIGGSSLSVGSVKVSTINLARIALESDSVEEYLEKLQHYVELDCIILAAVRHVIKRNVEKGLLQNFKHGLVDFKNLYNTIGFLGVYETLKTFGFTKEDLDGNVSYTTEGEELGRKIFDIIHNTAEKFRIDNDCEYHINCEQSPAETAADKLMKKDKFFYPETVIDDLPLYGNQFIPLGIKATLPERVKTQALFDSFCNGGSILHVNIDSPIDSFDKAWKLTKYIADSGVTYFAFNPRIQTCEHNHGFYGNTCPTCGGEVVNEYTRVVGFFTPINSWASARKNEYELRQWANVN